MGIPLIKMILLFTQNSWNPSHANWFPDPLKTVGTPSDILDTKSVPHLLRTEGDPLPLLFWKCPLVSLDQCILIPPNLSIIHFFHSSYPTSIVSLINPFTCIMFPSLTPCTIIWRKLLRVTHPCLHRSKEVMSSTLINQSCVKSISFLVGYKNDLGPWDKAPTL